MVYYIDFFQPDKGYRINGDSIALAYFIPDCLSGQSFLDIGTASGIIPLILAKRGFMNIYTLEIQKFFSPWAVKNLVSNGFGSGTLLLHGDARMKSCPFIKHSFENIVSNPPYYKINAGLKPESRPMQISKHETKLTCIELCFTALSLLRKGGNFFMSCALIRVSDYTRTLLPDFDLIEKKEISRKVCLLWFRKKILTSG